MGVSLQPLGHKVILRRIAPDGTPAINAKNYELLWDESKKAAVVFIDGKTQSIGTAQVGSRNSLPSPVTPGAFYYANDTSELFLCLGGEWVKIASKELFDHISARAPHIGHATLDNDGKVEQLPKAAKITPAPFSIPLSSDGGTIRLEWIGIIDGGEIE